MGDVRANTKGPSENSAVAGDRCGRERQPSLTEFFYLADFFGVYNVDIHDEIVIISQRKSRSTWSYDIMQAECNTSYTSYLNERCKS